MLPTPTLRAPAPSPGGVRNTHALTVRPDPYLARIVPAGPNPALALRFGHDAGGRMRTIKVTLAAGGLALALGPCWVVARRGARLSRVNHALRWRIAASHRPGVCKRFSGGERSAPAKQISRTRPGRSRGTLRLPNRGLSRAPAGRTGGVLGRSVYISLTAS